MAGGAAFLPGVAGMAFAFGQTAEPYADWGDYMGDVVRGLPGAITLALLLLFVGLLAFGLAVASGPAPEPHRPRRQAQARALLLNHVALFLPFAGWLAAAVLAALGRPSFGLLVEKPAWLASPLLRAAGSGHVAVLFLGVYVLNAGWAFRLIGRDDRAGQPAG